LIDIPRFWGGGEGSAGGRGRLFFIIGIAEAFEAIFDFNRRN